MRGHSPMRSAAPLPTRCGARRTAGIDIPDDGEFGKAMSAATDYGAWWNYAYERLGGFSPADKVAPSAPRRSGVASIGLTAFANRRDWQQFSRFYLDPESGGACWAVLPGGRPTVRCAPGR